MEATTTRTITALERTTYLSYYYSSVCASHRIPTELFSTHATYFNWSFQGSIHGPLLFVIYTNDLPHASDKFNVIKYANDTTLFRSVQSLPANGENSNINFENEINMELGNIGNWLTANKLAINVHTSKYMIYSKSKKLNSYPKLKIDDSIIQQVHEFNFLGIIFDDHWNWKLHIERCALKCSRNIGMLKAFPTNNNNAYIIPYFN